ncbi:unnamed protein product [Peniophora sp. CBMAI 1063]|nr:unnamed protein product [Peniophora sp. CBMAI 1063]
MVAAVDPTYPLFPVAAFLAAGMLLLILMTSLIRQSWNLGVAFLCFWLFIANLTRGINAIIWADNADIKLYVYCDIVTRLQLIAALVGPMSTLIITRRLYLIASLRTVEFPSASARRRDMFIEWTLGLVIPVLVAGPLFYTVQYYRFRVQEGFGCTVPADPTILTVLLVSSWDVIPPLVSVFFYYPKVISTFYRQGRDMNRFLRSNDSISRASYIRILALASIDLILTLPFGIVSLVIDINPSAGEPFRFYDGWGYVHLASDWQPIAFSYSNLLSKGNVTVSQFYFSSWVYPILSFIIFGFFGISSEARASYHRAFHAVCGWFGWKQASLSHGGLHRGDVHMGERSVDLEISSYPSHINPDTQLHGYGGDEGRPARDHECESDVGFKESK